MKKLVINKDHSVDGFMLLRDREMYDIEKSHGNLMNNTFVMNNDYTRSTMKVAFDKATIPIVYPDRPFIVSTYNRDLNTFNPYKKLKPKGYKEHARIFRNLQDGDPRYMVIYSVKKKLYMIEHKEFIPFGEGVAIYNKTCDSTHIKRTTSFTDDGMLCLGQNVLVAYLNMLDIIEDSSWVSDTFANRNKSLYVKSMVANLNDSVVFSSGKDSPFPKFGVKKKDNIGLAYNNDKNYSSLINPYVHDHRDDIQYLKDEGYFLGDMDIHYSMSIYDEFNHSYLKSLMSKDIAYHKQIYTALNSLVDNYDLDVSCKKFLDDYDYRFVQHAMLRDGTQELKKLRIIFHYFKENPISPGQKLSGGYGDKVTVSRVLDNSPGNEYFVDEHNRIIEFGKPTSGVPNRTNDGQLTEHNINHYAYMMLYGLREQKASRSRVEKCIVNFMRYIDDGVADAYVARFKEDPTLWDFILNDVGQILMDLNPFYYKLHICNFHEFQEFIMSTYPEKYKTPDDLLLKIYRAGKYVGKGMVSYIYIARAKQDANSKESIRAIDDEGSDGNNKKTDRGQRTSNNPVKSSEKDKANQASVFSRAEMRILEGKEKIKPMIAYNWALGFRMWR